jgi:electron transfer flavoprotein alpha subunit
LPLAVLAFVLALPPALKGQDRGQSGKSVRPRLYIAACISGAVQHRVGMEGADCIVAINSDPAAPIFDFAHFGLVGDVASLLPALTEAFRLRLRT